MQENYSAYERFLGFEKINNTASLMRARSVYIVGWAFIFTQFMNIFLMTITYGGWTLDHWISFGGIVSIIVIIHTLRLTHNFHFFAFSYSFLLLGGIFAAAVQVNTGANTAILPLLVAGCLLNGFIGGSRFVWVYAIASIALVWGLYFISVSAPPTDLSVLTVYNARIFQRAAQASLALILVSVFSAFMAGAMNQLFERLENRIEFLEVENQQKKEFLVSLTSELGTPVMGVNSMAGRLLDTTLDGEQTKIVNIMRRCAKRLARLVRDGSELSKLDAETFALCMTDFNLRTMVKQTIASFNSRAERRNIHIGMTFGAQLPEIYRGDEKRLKTVLRNIISNGLKFTESGSVHVYVDGRLKGADEVELRITIKDTGTGMPRDVMARVFNRFEQANGMTYQQSAGRGNGLAIAREYINFMGGDIGVESQVGEGSKFEISLTLHVAEGLNVSLPPDPHSTPALSANQAA